MDEIRVLGGSVRAGGALWEAVGLMGRGARVCLCLLGTPVGRFAAGARLDAEWLEAATEVWLDGQAYAVEAAAFGSLAEVGPEERGALDAFRRAGYTPHPALARRAPLDLYLAALELRAASGALRGGDAADLALRIGPGWEARPARARMTLQVGGAPVDGVLTDLADGGRHAFTIARVSLHPASAGLAAADPPGTCLAAVEYEAEEGIRLEFLTREALQAAKRTEARAVAVLVRPDAPAGRRRRAAALQTPVPIGTAEVEVEMLRYFRWEPERVRRFQREERARG
jgi:hypothetical protein